MLILVCELINELKAWNSGAIRQKRAEIQKAYYKTIQSEEGIEIIFREALRVYYKSLLFRFPQHLLFVLLNDLDFRKTFLMAIQQD